MASVNDFTVWKLSTGEIIKSGGDPHMAGPGETTFPGAYSADTHYFKDGVPTRRPVLPWVDPLGGQGFSQYETMPTDLEGKITIFIDSPIYEGEYVLSSPVVALLVPVRVTLRLTAPFPYLPMEIYLDGTPGEIPADAQIIQPDLEKMKAHFVDKMYLRSDDLTSEMLGNPSDTTRARWKLKRAILDRHLAGTLTDADKDALAYDVRYEEKTVEEHLDEIANKADSETRITMLADGVRSEAARRIEKAETPADVMQAIEWAEIEANKAVAEAITWK